MQPRLSPAVHRAPPAPSPAQPVERVWRGGGALSRLVSSIKQARGTDVAFVVLLYSPDVNDYTTVSFF
eukprot:6188958-Amphidinium_carterae.1